MQRKNEEENKENPKPIPEAKPFVLCVFDSIMKRYFILGSQPKTENNLKSEFGTKFKLAAQKTRIRFSCDSFENSLVEVHEDDFGKFLDSLIEC